MLTGISLIFLVALLFARGFRSRVNLLGTASDKGPIRSMIQRVSVVQTATPAVVLKSMPGT